MGGVADHVYWLIVGYTGVVSDDPLLPSDMTHRRGGGGGGG